MGEFHNIIQQNIQNIFIDTKIFAFYTKLENLTRQLPSQRGKNSKIEKHAVVVQVKTILSLPGSALFAANSVHSSAFHVSVITGPDSTPQLSVMNATTGFTSMSRGGITNPLT